MIDSVNEYVDQVAQRRWLMLVDGDQRPAESGGSYTTENPADETPLAQVPAATSADVDAAVDGARRAARQWSAFSLAERAARLRAMADALTAHRAELALLDALDGGNPVTAMEADVDAAASALRHFADWGMALKGETIPASAGNLHYTVREPFGVVARILPYNHPIMFAGSRIAAPLMAGNAVVVKAPDQTPLSALRMGELFAGLLPKGTLSVLTGSGRDVGDPLVRHPAVRRIGFIGSVASGRAVQKAAAESGVKDVTLELGGKNPIIVLPDADLRKAINGAVRGMNFQWCGGQSCGSTTRLFLHESLLAEALPLLRAAVEAITVGTPSDRTTDMGTMVSRKHFERVQGYIDAGRDAGARILTGGGRPAGEQFARGHYLSPTVFSDVTPDMVIAQEEIFGPVLSVLTWSDEDELVRMVNGVEYGLTASIWTNNLHTAHRLTQAVEAGYIWVNGSGTHYWGVPFGGVKNSGVGREESIDELLSFTRIKAINVIFDGA